MTNVDRPVFALRNLPEVVKGALFSRYSRSEKTLRQVFLDEFIDSAGATFPHAADAAAAEDSVAARNAEAFYDRVLVGYGDDSVAELAGAHLAVEDVSILAAKALEDSRIGISALEKSTRYVRFDKRNVRGDYLYHRGPELEHPDYKTIMDGLFDSYSELFKLVLEWIRRSFVRTEDETDRAWKSATRAKALDLIRGLLPAGALTNVGLYGNGRAFEYLVTKMAAHELPECNRLAIDMHNELMVVIPSFVRRALDSRHGDPAKQRMVAARDRVRRLAQPDGQSGPAPGVRLLDFDRDAERKVIAAALFPYSRGSLAALSADPGMVLDALVGHRATRRDRAPRAFESVVYTFEVIANFGVYRDLHRHRMLTQARQVLSTSLGFDVPEALEEYGVAQSFRAALEAASTGYEGLLSDLGEDLAQYAVPLAFRVRWYVRINLREIYYLCELRTAAQGHADYRFIAQEMYRRVRDVHPRLAHYARFVDMGPAPDLERRESERRQDLTTDLPPKA